MSTESDRKLEALLIQDDQVRSAQRRLNQLMRERKISGQDFHVARLRLQTAQDRIEVQIEMIGEGLPLISVPTEEELEAMRQKVANVEQQIGAAATADGLIGLVNTLAGGSVENA